LNETIRTTCNRLRFGAERQVADYEKRFSSIRSLYDELLVHIVQKNFSKTRAYETAIDFFKAPTVRFAGIDGTMYSRPMFDMVIFFGGAYASTGSIRFNREAGPDVVYDAKTTETAAGISSVVPIYINDVPEVDQTFFVPGHPDEVNIAKALTDESIVDNSIIANSIMTFSEYYLALKLAMDRQKPPGLILLDRSLSAERASLLYDTSQTELWRAKSALIGQEVEGIRVDANDLLIARHHICNTSLSLPPPRADYLRYALIELLKNEGALSFEQILEAFQINDAKRVRRVKRALKNLILKEILLYKNNVYVLSQRYTSTWERLKKLTLQLGEQIFYEKPGDGGSIPLRVQCNGKERWLTTLDLAFLTLFTLNMLLEECWRNRILLVGITKDTAARDFKRQFVPIMCSQGFLCGSAVSTLLKEMPNTDRMILQSVSVLNAEKMTPPWSLIEYDSAFRTMMPDKLNRKDYVSGAIKNKISLEKAFLKTYIQLSQAKSDPLLRSNVLFIDRLAHPEYDFKPETRQVFLNELSDGTVEPVEVILYKSNTVSNDLQNLLITILVAMAPANIPEAFGHNKALFIADKIAKWNYNQFKCVVDTTAKWILNNHRLRKFVFYMSTFRERRATIEAARRETL